MSSKLFKSFTSKLQFQCAAASVFNILTMLGATLLCTILKSSNPATWGCGMAYLRLYGLVPLLPRIPDPVKGLEVDVLSALKLSPHAVQKLRLIQATAWNRTHEQEA
jgi:hypothetical protein